MGQYYVAVILGPAGEQREFIRVWVDSFPYNTGCKLMEHSYVGNQFVSAVEHLLSPEGPYWKSRVVWAGDYADVEATPSRRLMAPCNGACADVEGAAVDSNAKNLYHIAKEDETGKQAIPPSPDMSSYPYIVNHTKRLYVVKDIPPGVRSLRINPLPLLTAEGNGRGGGDFGGTDEDSVGSWARDVISVEKVAPEGYTCAEYEFEEN